MSNRVTRWIDLAAFYVGYVIDIPPKGAYAAALVFMFVAYAIHAYQVQEFSNRVNEAQYEKSEQRKLDNKTKEQAEQPPTGSKQGC